MYEATAQHFRDIRVVEIEKMQQRAKSNNRRFNVHDLAADIWDAAELEDATPLAEWMGQQPESDALVSIPEERPVSAQRRRHVLAEHRVLRQEAQTYVDCPSRGQAELVERLANLGVTGEVKLPAELAPCFKLLDRMNRRVEKAIARFDELAKSRTGDERIQQQLMDVLKRWYVEGREVTKPVADAELDAR